MPAIEEDGPTPGELRALRDVLAQDLALADELELILPALEPGARAAFCRELAETAGERPAAAVLTALVAAARR
jgi:hypothetical protein